MKFGDMQLLHGPRRSAAWAGALAMTASLLVLSGCGERKSEATQVAARVNSSDVTVHQINFLMQQDHGIRPEQADAASRKVLEGLIEQELAVQKALELKLDREPQVAQTLEAARRDVLARAYRDHVTDGTPKPTAEETRRYYDANPALFAQRRVYSLQELVIDLPADKRDWLKERLAHAKSADDLSAALKAEGIRFGGSHVVKPAEQLPMSLVPRLAAMKDGDSITLSDGPPVRVDFIAASRVDPVAYERAQPAIEQFLLTAAKRRTIDENLKALRTAAKVTYQGKFAAPAADIAAEPPRPSVPDSAVPAAAASGIDPDLAKKGMGLK